MQFVVRLLRTSHKSARKRSAGRLADPGPTEFDSSDVFSHDAAILARQAQYEIQHRLCAQAGPIENRLDFLQRDQTLPPRMIDYVPKKVQGQDG